MGHHHPENAKNLTKFHLMAMQGHRSRIENATKRTKKPRNKSITPGFVSNAPCAIEVTILDVLHLCFLEQWREQLHFS